jgi:hypothetical protein
MAREIHYEVFKRQGAKGGWTMHEVASDREAALRMADFLMKEGGATGVKVVKETYDDVTGDYLTLKIFEDGHNQMKTSPVQEEVPHAIPCFKPDDLYSYHARATIARLLVDFLGRNRLTVTELIHRADMLEKLEATGTVYQHAIQKIAVAQAANTTTPVQTIMKSLNELVTNSIHRVYRDAKKDYFPKVAKDGFAKLAEKLATQGDGAYVLNGAMARHLSDCKGWDEKTARLLAIMATAPKEGDGRQLLLSSIDAMLAEMLNGSAALHELIGAKENLGESLTSLVQLFLGKEQDNAGEGLTKLTSQFATDSLPEARTAIALRIVAEFKSQKRFCPDSLVDELKTLRQLANRVVMGVGKYLSHEDLVAAFMLRSKRLVSHELLSAHIADAATPDEKIERLLFVEENIIGAENKRTLATFLQPIITQPSFENHFLSGKLPVVARLQKLAHLQTRVLRSQLQENQRAEIADILDRIASEAETRAKLFESIEIKSPSSVERAVTMLKLMNSGVCTEGRVSGRAREIIIGHMSRPGFLTGYIALLSKDPANANPNADTAMAELMETLGKVGITAETGLKSIAA